ncbi:hypothetical protein ACP4OV_018157 [Aristida adscensionis]
MFYTGLYMRSASSSTSPAALAAGMQGTIQARMADSVLQIQMVDQQERAYGHSHAVNIDAVLGELTEEPVTDELGAAAPFNIAEVRDLTRNVNKTAYDPHYVSIGPYHRTKDPRLAKDDEKKRCLRVVRSSAARPGGATVAQYLRELEPRKDEAWSYYDRSYEADLKSAQFVRMLLLDACYLLVWLGAVDGRPRSDTATANDHETLSSSSLPEAAAGDMLEAIAVVRDVLYLAENQIPFFVVDLIHGLTVLDGHVSAAEAIARYIRSNILQRQKYSMVTPAAAELSAAANLLHLLHMHFKPAEPPSGNGGRERAGDGELVRWRRATEYSLVAGVQFRARRIGAEEGAQCILDVKHGGSCGGTVKIPRLSIDGETWRILHNLIALEQSNPAIGSHVTAYCVFMSQLACTTEDVELLSKRGVIVHGLGNHNEVAAGFAKLCKGVAFRVDDADRDYLWPTYQALERCFQSSTRRWMALLRRKYFGNPWLVVGLAAGAVGLACAVVQAVYSVLAYKH